MSLMEAFLVATIAVITEKIVFFLFSWQPLLGKQILSLNHAAYKCNQSLKKWNQADKVYSRKIITKV